VHWLDAEFERAARQWSELPEWAKPIYCPPEGIMAKCADIPDELFLEAVRNTEPVSGRSNWRMRWAVRETLESLIGPVPEKLFLAKARKLGLKGKLHGCTSCDCRGDYHLPEECTGNC